MKLKCAAVMTALMTAVELGAAQCTPAVEVTDQQVKAAIESLKCYLYARQDPASGSWERNLNPATPRFGGTSALVVSALLLCGETWQNPPLGRAVQFLKAAELSGTYEVAARAHVWALLPDDYRSLIERDAMWLAGAHDGRSRFRYTRRPSTYDHSATQYALLGLWEAAKRGIRIPRTLWEGAQSHFMQAQNPDGGWGYQHPGETKASMTAAGLTALLIVQQQLYANRIKPPRELTASIERALTWLDDHFDGARNVTAGGQDGMHHYYYLYSIERVALAGGVKILGGQDWFHVGADHILENMSVDPRTGCGSVNGNVVDSAFALMFLARGRVATWMTKLAVPGQRWNNRPNDVNHLTAYLSDLCEREVNWQTVSVDRPADLMINAPVAFLASDSPLQLSEWQEATIKRYIDLGGLLLASPDNGSARFMQSVRDLAKKLYPHWPMRRLAPGHGIYRFLYRIPKPVRQKIEGVSNGARDLILLAGRDWGMHFQADKPRGRKFPWKLAANLYSMITDRGRMPGRVILPFEARKHRQSTGRVMIGRARYGPNPQAGIVEPAAWFVFSHHLFNRTGIELTVNDLDLSEIGRSSLPLIHLSGVSSVTLTDAELAAIDQYVHQDGTLLVETVGGNGGFCAGVEKQLNALFQSSATTLSSRSPLIDGSSLTGGYDNRRVKYRRYTVAKLATRDRSRMAAYDVEGRPAVIVSREDLSLGMLGVRHWSILGYRPESVRRLLSNIVLWVQGGEQSVPE